MLIGRRLFLTAMTLLSFFMFQSNLSAAEDSNIDPLANISVSKDDILKSLDALKKQGRISNEDYERAKKDLMGMSEAQVNGIKDTAVGMVRNDPDKAVSLVNGKKVDLKEVEKQASEANKKK